GLRVVAECPGVDRAVGWFASGRARGCVLPTRVTGAGPVVRPVRVRRWCAVTRGIGRLFVDLANERGAEIRRTRGPELRLMQRVEPGGRVEGAPLFDAFAP